MFDWLIDGANDLKEAAIVAGGVLGVVMILMTLKDRRALVPVISMVLIVAVVLFAISDQGQQFTSQLVGDALQANN